MTERGLNQAYYKRYFLEQSSYLCYLLIGFHIILQTIESMGEHEAYLEVMFGSAFLGFKLIQFWLNALYLVFIYGIWIPIFYFLSFNEFDILMPIWIQLLLNTCVFSGFMVLWIRIKSTYVILFGLMMLVLHPNLNDLLPNRSLDDWCMPFNRGQFTALPIWLSLTYYWVSYHLQHIKPK
jgi:hypothetical protein